MDLVVQRAFSSRIFLDVSSIDRFPQRYFAAYEVTKKALAPAGAPSSDLNIGQVILAGGTAGVAMWAIAIPPDVRVI
jgi:hypothetical protein